MSRRSGESAKRSVSAIIPVYNGAPYVGAALASVLVQDEPPDEVIVIDDGSSDDSVEIIQATAGDALAIPVKITSQANQGQSAARNEAARVASGELLAFLDQDDVWYPKHLGRLTKPFSSRPDLGWTYSDFDEIDAGGRTVTRGFISTHVLDHPKRTLSQFLMADMMMLPSASVISAKAFHDVGGFDPGLRGYEDDDLFIRLFRGGWRSEYVRQSLTKFRVHPTSSSAGARFRESRIRFLDKLTRDIPNDQRLNRFYIRDLVFPRMFQSTLAEYATAMRSGDYEQAREIAAAVAEIDRRSPGGRKRQAELYLLARPELFRRVLATHDRLPRRLRPHINEALRLKPRR